MRPVLLSFIPPRPRSFDVNQQHPTSTHLSPPTGPALVPPVLLALEAHTPDGAAALNPAAQHLDRSNNAPSRNVSSAAGRVAEAPAGAGAGQSWVGYNSRAAAVVASVVAVGVGVVVAAVVVGAAERMGYRRC